MDNPSNCASVETEGILACVEMALDVVLEDVVAFEAMLGTVLTVEIVERIEVEAVSVG